MKKVVLITTFLFVLAGNLFSQEKIRIEINYSKIDLTLRFGPLPENIAYLYFGSNEDLFWSKWNAIKDVESRKEKMIEYTIEVAKDFIKHYELPETKKYRSVIVQTGYGKENNVTSIDRIRALYRAALLANWGEMEKAANQLGFTYDQYLYY